MANTKENETENQTTDTHASPVGFAIAFLVLLGLIIAAGVLGSSR